MRIDGRREVKPRFGYREKSGATETLSAKRVENKNITTQGEAYGNQSLV